MIWKDIQGYEGLYQVSLCGKVRSLRRIVTMRNGRNKLFESFVIKDHIKKGYHTVCLNNKGKRMFLLHRLVAIHFIENSDEKKIC